MNASLRLALLRGSLSAGRLRLALTVACIALGVAMGAAVHTVHSSALAEIDRAAHALAGRADLEIRGPRNGFDDAAFARIAARPEVAAASPIVEVEAAVEGSERTLSVLGIDPLRAISLQPAFVTRSGAIAAPGAGDLLDPRAIRLTPDALARLRLQAGSPLRLLSGSGAREYRVAGALPGFGEGADLAVIDIAAAQRDFGREGLISRVDVRLKPGVDTARFTADVAKILPPGVAASPAAAASGRAAAITRAYRVNLDALSLVALATGAFLVFSTLALQAARRRQEFALLRALGLTRRELSVQLALEALAIGAAGAASGTLLGLAASRVLLGHSGADLGAGYFGGHGGAFAVDAAGLAAIAALGIAMAVIGAAWVAHAVGRVDIAEALRDRAVDLPHGGRGGALIAAALALAGIPLLFLPPVADLPLFGYAAIALWLAASVAAVAPLCRTLLARLAPRGAVASLALAQVRHLPGHLAASVAGIVVSASLCVAMAIMVFSFRVSLEDWLAGVVDADLYLRPGGAGDTGFFSPQEQHALAALPQVARIEALRYDRLALPGQQAPLTLIARPIHERILDAFRVEPRGVPRDDGTVPVWISEAARDLHQWKVGDALALPMAGREVHVRVAGVVRDYARTWGAVLVDLDTYRRITGDARANDLHLFLAQGVAPREAQRAIRAALPGEMQLEDAGELKHLSLAIFDRSFAVTYALEALAIAIGLAGVTSSFAALAWSRRREFGVLRFLGLTRGEVLRMLAIEGAAAGVLGALLGLASGAAISVVLVQVVNRQSFHWTLEVHWPWAALAVLAAGVVATCTVGARLSGAWAVRREAVLAVKDDA